MSTLGGARRWILVTAIVSAAATAMFLGAALADARSGSGLLFATVGCLGATILAGGVLVGSRPAGDPAVERAETAEHLAEQLRGPLVSLRSLSAAGVRVAAELTEEDRLAFFVLIDEEAARLRRSVEGISAALRIEAGGIRYDLREEDLARLIEEAIAEVPTGAHPIHLELEPDLQARVDRLRLGEALETVIDNAATFSPPDAPIEVRAFRDPDRSAVIEIADHGPGIPEPHRPSLFHRGVRWRPPGYEETPGSGVGLFVARAHVTGQGGEIRLEDRPEGERGVEPGTVVRIVLPPVA